MEATGGVRPRRYLVAATYAPGRTSSVSRRTTTLAPRGGALERMTKLHYRKPPWWLRHIGNRFSPRNAKLVARLSVPGRTSGQWRTTPVVVLDHDGGRYLVAPGGQTEWARNLRVAGEGRLIRRERVEEFTAEELPARDRPPVLAAYLDRYGRMPTVKAGFRAFPDPADHPTFRITPAAPGDA
jgi:deazaflavin-dependent oxidoreductase (nitroreductase family)